MARISEEQRKKNEQRNHLSTGIERFAQMLEQRKDSSGDTSTQTIKTSGLRSETPPPTDPEKTIENPDGIFSVVQFCEHPYFLNLRLTPWQRIIVKAFYAGTAGNTQLKLEDDRDEVGCGGCVWSSNRKAEETLVDSVRKKGRIIDLNMMLPSNSPCLTCKRFDKQLREERYEYLRSRSITPKKRKEIDELALRQIEDCYSTERDLFNNDLSPDVRDQVADKWGAQFQELILVLGRRSGKALALDTPILTTNGWSTMGDLVVGDYVYGDDGKPTKIIATSQIWRDRPCYEVEFSNGEVIVADEEHDWSTVNQRERKNAARSARLPIATVHTTKEIAETLYVSRNDQTKQHNHAIMLAPALDMPEQQLPIDPYVFGVWLGDGTRINGMISTADQEIIDSVREAGYEPRKDRTAAYAWRISAGTLGVPLLTQLKALGVTTYKHIPKEYLCSSIQQRWDLLAGLMDTDGDISPNGHCTFNNTNPLLAEQFLELAISLGIKAVLHEGVAKLEGKEIGPAYRVMFTPPTGSAVFRLKRKKNRLAKNNKADIGRVFIKRVTKLENSVPVKCIQVDNDSHLYLAGKSLIPTHNSFMVAIITLYEVYRLIKMGHPQSRYPLLEFDMMTLCNVAVSEGQAKAAIFDKIVQMVLPSPFFKPYIGKTTLSEIHFRTPHDLEENERRIQQGQTQDLLSGTIQLMSGHSNSKSLVGRTMYLIIIDEMAAMATASADGGTDSDLYSQLKPALATFGEDGKIICISNPLGPIGKFYKLYQDAFLDDTTLMFQLATWKSNPNISAKLLKSERLKDPQNYEMHYGAKFGASGSEPFLPAEVVYAAFERANLTTRKEHGDPLVKYYAHLDPAENSDWYALAVVHTEPTDELGPDGKALMKVVIDHVNYWKPNGPNSPVNSEEVDSYVIDLHKRFRFSQVSYDHWNSNASITRLRNNGINAVKKPFTKEYQDCIFQEAYDLFTSGRIDIYNINSQIATPEGPCSLNEANETKEQLLFLQKKWKAKKWKIEAVDGGRDDICDCIAAAAYEALKVKIYEAPPRPRSVYFGGRLR